jgi:hypothetical protein
MYGSGDCTRCELVRETRVVTREIRKNVGQINEVVETRKTVEESVEKEKRKQEPSEKHMAKDEKRDNTMQRF